MNKNVLIVLAGGFVIAILVAVLVQASLGGKAPDDSAPKLQVLVASKDLAVGSDLTPSDLKWQTWPGDKAFAGAIVREAEQKPEEALTGRLVQPVAAGQPVLVSYTFKEGKGNIVAATLGKGMRAVAIPVKADTMAGGFVSPGDFVDVILSYNVSTNSRENPDVQGLVDKSASETILQNIKILAVDQEATRDEDKAKVARTVTLEVTSGGAEKLALAANMGDLTLALRGIGDDVHTTGSATTDVSVGQTLRDVARLQGVGEGASGRVRVYNGATMEEVRTRGAGGFIGGNNNQAVSTPETSEDAPESNSGLPVSEEESIEGDR